MFHTMIILAYVIPNIYVFFRILFLFINKGYRIHFTIIYLVLALLYPLSSLASENGSGIVTTVSNFISGYILPFYLYLFLSVLLYDLFLLLNLLVKLLPPELRNTTRYKKSILSSIVILSLIVLLAGIINFNTIRTTEYNIEIPARSSSSDGLRIAFASDFHLKQNVNRSFVERFVKKAEEIKPDLMIYGGDIVEGDRNDGELTYFENKLKEIKTKYGSYGVLGNHEYYSGREDGGFFRKAGITLLNDTSVIIDNSFTLAGRIDSHFRDRKNVEELMQYVNDSLPVILIDHRPTELDQVSRTKADVQISGHTHDGQLFPINLITRSVYELSYGYLKKGNTHFFVSSGIRLWGPPVRTVAKSEIVVINIQFKK